MKIRPGTNWFTNRRRRFEVLALAGLVFAAGGCKKDPASSAGGAPANATAPDGMTANLSPVNPADPPQAQEQARLAVVQAMRRGDAPPPPPAIKLAGGEPATPEILTAYNQHLLRARLQERRSPENLDDLVQKWINRWRLLPALPTPPAGKRIVYDDVNCIIRLDPP